MLRTGRIYHDGPMAGPSFRLRDGGLAALAAVAVHGRSALFGFTGLDDRDLVVDDQAFLARASSLVRVFGRSYMHVVDAAHAYWRPLVTATLVIDAQWSGAHPLGYHVTNVVLHAAASFLVVALLHAFGLGRIVAALGGVVFAVHPGLAAAVAWIPGRNDSLLAVLGLAAWLAWMRHRERPSAAALGAHLALFAAALLTKETALALPLVWGVQLALLPPRSGRDLFLPGAWATMLAARLLVHAPGAHASPAELLAHAPVFLAALGQIAAPVRPSAIAVVEDLPLWPGLVVVAGLALAVARAGGVRRRVLALGGIAFVLLLAPALAAPGTLVLAQRDYLPSVGVLLAGGEVVRALAPERRALVAAGSVLASALALLTVASESAFRDPAAFAREAVAASPRCALAHFCLGQVYQRAGQDDQALAEYRVSLALGPGEVVHNDVAVIAMKYGRWGEAERELREELALDPRYGRAWRNLAVVLRHEDRLPEACDAAGRALALSDPDDGLQAERARDCAPPVDSAGRIP